MSGFTALVARDLRLVWRRPGDVAVVLAFFVVATVLFPLGIGPEANLLARIAAGVLWCAALFASLLSLDRLFAVRLRGRHARPPAAGALAARAGGAGQVRWLTGL